MVPTFNFQPVCEPSLFSLLFTLVQWMSIGTFPSLISWRVCRVLLGYSIGDITSFWCRIFVCSLVQECFIHPAPACFLWISDHYCPHVSLACMSFDTQLEFAQCVILGTSNILSPRFPWPRTLTNHIGVSDIGGPKAEIAVLPTEYNVSMFWLGQSLTHTWDLQLTQTLII